jgi:putative endonuclease
MYIDSNDARKTLGHQGEDAVAHKLSANEFTILARNFRKKGGEIDIIARKKDLIIFVEVKTRKAKYFALSEIITFSKQRKIITTALLYILEHKLRDVALRFDIALVQKINTLLEINYIENAFQPFSE